MSTLYVNNIEPVSGSELTLISASLVSVDNLSVASLTSSFQGDLQGTASFATTASHALNSTSAAGTDGQVQFNSGSEFGADSNLFWDNTNKRLGIGTNAPQSIVEINHNPTGINNTTGLIINNGAFGSTYKSIIFSSGTSEKGTFGLHNQTGEFRWGMSSGGFFPTIYSNGSEAMRINISRNVGIGETSPTARLQVKGSGTTSATKSLLVQNSNSVNVLSMNDSGHWSTTTSNYSSVITNDGDSLQVKGSIAAIRVGATITIEQSAILQADSTTKGFLPPRMTTTQKNAISTPAEGLQVYDSTASKMSVYNSGSWENIVTEASGSPNQVNNIWSGTQAQYDALTPSATTVYFII